MATTTIFVHWHLEELVGLAMATAGVSLEIGQLAEYDGGYEMDVIGTAADVAAFEVAYNGLFSDD